MDRGNRPGVIFRPEKSLIYYVLHLLRGAAYSSRPYMVGAPGGHCPARSALNQSNSVAP
jgi:hypothetical protein